MSEFMHAVVGLGSGGLLILILYLSIRFSYQKKCRILKELGYTFHPQGYTTWRDKGFDQAPEYIRSDPGWIKEINGKTYVIEDPTSIVEFPRTMKARVITSEEELLK